MEIKIFSVLPEILEGWRNHGLINRAIKEKMITLKTIDIRQYGQGKYKRVDDYTLGGGSAGMIMRPDVLSDCIEDNVDFKAIQEGRGKIIVTSPRGVPWDHESAIRLNDESAGESNFSLNIVTNRFEAIDQRVIDYYGMQEVSIGKYVLSGGEIAAMVIIDSFIRLRDGIISSAAEESFSKLLDGRLEYDQFTRPFSWKGIEAPEVLVSGNHAEIQKWRVASSIFRTKKKH